MDSKILKKFIIHLNKYNKIGDIYYQKGYSRSYTEGEVIEHFNKKLRL